MRAVAWLLNDAGTRLLTGPGVEG